MKTELVRFQNGVKSIDKHKQMEAVTECNLEVRRFQRGMSVGKRGKRLQTKHKVLLDSVKDYTPNSLRQCQSSLYNIQLQQRSSIIMLQCVVNGTTYCFLFTLDRASIGFDVIANATTTMRMEVSLGQGKCYVVMKIHQLRTSQKRCLQHYLEIEQQKRPPKKPFERYLRQIYLRKTYPLSKQ